jgi:hypothetical protein
MASPQNDKEHLDELRERLYQLGGEGAPSRRTKLDAAPQAAVPRNWEEPAQNAAAAQKKTSQSPGIPVLDTRTFAKYMPYKNGSRTYRLKILLVGAAFFVLALALSSLFLLFGNNTISGENISIKVTGPFAVGGGAEIPLQISIANENAIAIEQATLIIEYPPGTQSAEEEGKELFTVRQEIDSINAGQIVNVPVRARIFGEENAEKEINVSIEYRVRGSNATFYKEAEPLRFKVSSSPVVLLIDTVRSITSGQEMEVKLTVASNSPTPLRDVLVEATYPFGFDFSSANPGPDAAQNVWLIEELKPEETVEITFRGVMTGKENDERVFDFSVGLPSERDRFSLASVFTTAKAEVDLEGAFLGIDVVVNGSNDEVVVMGNSESANVRVSFKNTLDETVYDGNIEVKLGGSALSKVDVRADGGFYSSSNNTIRWDGADESSLREIAPGRANAVSFMLDPREDVSRTPEITIEVTVRGERTTEDRVPEELVSTAKRTLRFTSNADLSSSAAHDESMFDNDGPTPPVAEETTEYTLTFRVRSGSNELTQGEMTATLPQYVTWLGNVSPGDSVTYNASSRTLTWKVGSLDANDSAEASVQVAVTPSVSQVNTIPTILETQRFRATDRFTGAVIRSEAPALTTAIPGDSGRVEAD